MKLRYTADIRSIAFVFFYFGLLVAQWVYVPRNLAIAIPLVVLTCFFSFFGAVITHNTIHSPVFVKRSHNRVFQVLLSLTYGSAVSAFVPGHNLSHHKHVQTTKDVMRTTKVRHNWNLLNMMQFAPVVGWAIMKNDAAYVGAMKTKHKKWFQQYRIETFAWVSVTILLFILDWKKALIYWQIPHFYAAWGIISMNYLQHDGCDMEHEFNHSRNFTGKVVNWFAFNNGYHGVHHDKAGLHWSLTPADHEARYHGKIDPRLEVKSMPLYLFKTFIFPAKRRTFDGKPVELPPKGADENWIPDPKETPEDLGAVAVG